MANDATAQTFSISTSSLAVTLADELDYEVVQEYYLLMSVTDTSLSLTGYIGVRVSNVLLIPINISLKHDNVYFLCSFGLLSPKKVTFLFMDLLKKV